MIIALSKLESTLEEMITYQEIDTGTRWTRPAMEFLDGRFLPETLADRIGHAFKSAFINQGE